MDMKTFKAIQNIGTLASKYNQKAEASEGEQKQIFEQYVLELDDLYDNLLRIGKHAETDAPEMAGMMNQTVNGISAYTQVHIVTTYETGYSLVITTAMDMYLVPTESVTVM